MPRAPHTSRQAIVLLWTLLNHRSQWQYGYALMQDTGLKSGTIYPLLIRLAEGGYLDARWEEAADGQKPRRLYKLTADGEALARDRVSRLNRENQPDPANGLA